MSGPSTSYHLSWYRGETVENPFMYVPRAAEYSITGATVEMTAYDAGGMQVEIPLGTLTLVNTAFRAISGRSYRFFQVSEGPAGPNSRLVTFHADGTTSVSSINSGTTTGTWRFPGTNSHGSFGCAGTTHYLPIAGAVESTAILGGLVWIMEDGSLRLGHGWTCSDGAWGVG